jgi:hypothetical protein
MLRAARAISLHHASEHPLKQKAEHHCSAFFFAPSGTLIQTFTSGGA